MIFPSLLTKKCLNVSLAVFKFVCMLLSVQLRNDFRMLSKPSLRHGSTFTGAQDTWVPQSCQIMIRGMHTEFITGPGNLNLDLLQKIVWSPAQGNI